jgi:Na+/proline symporter
MASLTYMLTLMSMGIYVWAGFSPNARSRNEDQYFFAGKTISADDYANVSVGYALQMAAVFLFAYWGFLYGVGALWTALFWGLGYYILYAILPKFKEYRALNVTETLHFFIRQRFSSSRNLQVLAAVATLIGLMGTMFAEVDYTVAVYHPVLNVDAISLQLAFLVSGAGYIIWNGYQAEVKAERFQVPLAYIGLIVVLLAVLPGIYKHSGASAYWITSGVLGISFAIMAAGKLIDITADRDSKRIKWMNWQAAIPLCALVALFAESTWVHLTLTSGSAENIFNKPISNQLLAQGIVGLISLLIANALWMPVDVSTWQRIASVGGSEDEGQRALRRGTFRVMLESPASWCLGAVLGWTINAGGYVPANYSDPYSIVAAFADALFKGGKLALFGIDQSNLYPVFVVSCVAVMLSTVTSILSAVSLTADRDLLPDSLDNIKRVRILSAILLLLGFVVYEGLRAIFKANLPTLIYGAYSAQLSLFVCVMFALYRRRLSARAAVWSIVTGLLFALGATALAIARSEQPELAVLPPLFAVLGSTIGYVVGYKLVDYRSIAPRDKVEPAAALEDTQGKSS